MLGRYSEAKLRNGIINYIDATTTNEINLQESKNIIVDNSGYDPTYLRTCYVIEFYEILKHVQEKLKRATESQQK